MAPVFSSSNQTALIDGLFFSTSDTSWTTWGAAVASSNFGSGATCGGGGEYVPGPDAGSAAACVTARALTSALASPSCTSVLMALMVLSSDAARLSSAE